MDRSHLKILLLEDNPGDAELIREILDDINGLEFSLVTVERLSSALNLLEGELFDLVLSDLNLPDAQGLDILQKLRDKSPQTPIIIMSGICDDEIALLSRLHGSAGLPCQGSN